MHEYLRNSLIPHYEDCKYCKNRSQFACIKCGSCWSCHWKTEQFEKMIELSKPRILSMEI